MKTIGGKLSRVPAVVLTLIGVGTMLFGVRWYLGMISTPPSGETAFGGLTTLILGVFLIGGSFLLLVGVESYRYELVAIPSAAIVASAAFIIAVEYEVHNIPNTQLGILRLLGVTALPAVMVWAGLRSVKASSGS